MPLASLLERNGCKPVARKQLWQGKDKPAAGFSWAQKCSAEGSFPGINFFRLVLDSPSSVIFFFCFNNFFLNF